MDREKLLQNPLPIDRVAARVVRAAKPESLWRPMPREVTTGPPLGAILQTKLLPESSLKSNPALRTINGTRRDRMVVVGYSADQPQTTRKDKSAKWVVRCDCGNYEHRTSILRWVATEAPDMCRECQHRAYKLRGGKRTPDAAPALRKTVIAA